MDPNLTLILLNPTLNATLIQTQQPWWTSDAFSTIITAFAAILAVFIGQKMAKSAEDGSVPVLM